MSPDELCAPQRAPPPVPGNTDVWKPVHLFTSATGVPARLASLLSRPFRRLGRSSSAGASPAGTAPSDSPRTSSRRTARVVIGGALILLTGIAGTAYAQAHKTVRLDVDGTVTTLSTFAGSVDGVLRAQHVEVGSRDTVAPLGGTGLRDGAEIVVRHAHQVQIETDGVASTVWTTALSADEALQTMASRGGDVRLVASRSSSGRPELALDLTVSGPVRVQVDGTVLTAPDGSRTVADLLAELGVTLGALDKVSVQDGQPVAAGTERTEGGDGTVTVVVNRIVVQDVSTAVDIPFATTTTDDPSRYTGQKKVRTAGVAGSHTVVERVTTVDGVESSRETVSDTVTAAPVDAVVAVGTKTRPVVTRAATPVAAGGSADSLNWAALARCESGGNPTIVSRSGSYHGLYQFSTSTWAGVGGSGLPSQASADEQTARAKMLYNRSGAGQWPVCGAKLFS